MKQKTLINVKIAINHVKNVMDLAQVIVLIANKILYL